MYKKIDIDNNLVGPNSVIKSIFNTSVEKNCINKQMVTNKNILVDNNLMLISL